MAASINDFQLKAVKHSEFASQETHCYEAKLYYKGKAVAVVSNDGHGGCDYHYPLPGCELDWQDAVVAAKSLPAIETSIIEADGKPWMMECTIETLCHDLLEKHLAEKQFKRLISNRVLWIKEGNSNIWQTQAAKNKAVLESYIKQIQLKDDTKVVLNTLPVAEALELFRSAA